MRDVIIVGGGLAGLTALHALHTQGIPAKLFEAGERIAGLASSFRDADGFSSDFGAHFITNRLAAAIGVGHLCRDVPRYGESVALDGRVHDYPFGLMRVPRFLASALAARMHGEAPAASAADRFRAAYGAAFAEEVALPLIEAWSGAPADRLAPAVMDKLPTSIARTVYLKVAARVFGKAIAVGYCRELPESATVWHVYPDGGVATLCEALAAGLEEHIHLSSRVERIYVLDGRACGVRVNGQDHDAAAVISTAPVHVLPRLVEGTDALQPLARFRYRPMVFANLRFRGRGLLPDVVTWVPDRTSPFFRLTEAPLSMPWLAPEGKTQITADLGCEVGDAIWGLDDERLGELCLERLEALVPGIRGRYLGCRGLRTPIAYPVFLNDYDEDRQRLAAGPWVAGLYSVGRNGEFDHILMEDVYERTLRRIPEIVRLVRSASPLARVETPPARSLAPPTTRFAAAR